MPNFEDISRSNTPVDNQESALRNEPNVVEAGKEMAEKGEEAPVVPVEAPVVATAEEKQARIDDLTKTIGRTNEELARVREGLGLPSVQQADAPSVAIAKENLARLNAETETPPQMKEMTGGWKGNWKAGGRPDGYISITDQRKRLEKGGFKLEKGLLQSGWVTKDFQEMAQLTRKAKAQGLLTGEETDQLLQYNQRVVRVMDDFEDKQKKEISASNLFGGKTGEQLLEVREALSKNARLSEYYELVKAKLVRESGQKGVPRRQVLDDMYSTLKSGGDVEKSLAKELENIVNSI